MSLALFVSSHLIQPASRCTVRNTEENAQKTAQPMNERYLLKLLDDTYASTVQGTRTIRAQLPVRFVNYLSI